MPAAAIQSSPPDPLPALRDLGPLVQEGGAIKFPIPVRPLSEEDAAALTAGISDYRRRQYSRLFDGNRLDEPPPGRLMEPGSLGEEPVRVEAAMNWRKWIELAEDLVMLPVCLLIVIVGRWLSQKGEGPMNPTMTIVVTDPSGAATRFEVDATDGPIWALERASIAYIERFGRTPLEDGCTLRVEEDS